MKKSIKKEMSLYSKIEQAIMLRSFDHLTAGATTRKIMKLIEDQETKDNWDDICEEFNVKVADKEKFFVTATQFFNYLKKNYHSPKRKLKQ